MTGKMAAPSQNLDRQVECILAEAWPQSAICNEDMAKQTVAWLDTVSDLMNAGNAAFPWPGEEQVHLFQEREARGEQGLGTLRVEEGGARAR